APRPPQRECPSALSVAASLPAPRQIAIRCRSHGAQAITHRHYTCRGSRFHLPGGVRRCRHRTQAGSPCHDGLVVPDGGGPQPPLGGAAVATVAVVDDDAAIRLVCRVALELAGYAVVEAPDGEAGLEVVRAASPDLALVDVMMPRLDGMAM